MPGEAIYLSLGSNVGDRAANLRAAIDALAGIGVEVSRVSSFYETEPVDYLRQSWFLNCVVQAKTILLPEALLGALRGIESQLGSKKEFEKGPRILDMDLLLYGNQTIETPNLKVPHPRMLQRKFVLIPLQEIAPQVRHPLWPGDATQMLRDTPDRSEVRKLS